MLCIHPTPSEEYRSTITYKSVYFKSGLDKLIAKIPLEGKEVKYRYVYDEHKTPFERLKEADPENPKLARYSRFRNMINSIALKEMLEEAIAEETGKRPAIHNPVPRALSRPADYAAAILLHPARCSPFCR